jgi:hypothetical protein
MTIEVSKAICKKLLETPLSTTFKSPRADFIKETFMDNPDDFCQFMGFMKEHLSTIKMRRDEAVSIMSDIALAAVTIGRKDGRDETLRRYGAPEYQFLLNDKKQEVVA